MKKYIANLLITIIFVSNVQIVCCAGITADSKQAASVSENYTKEKRKHKNNKQIDNKIEYMNLKWWNKFQDPILTEYIIKTADSNYDIKINALKVLEGQEVVKESFGNELPSINFNSTVSREKFSGSIPYAGMFFPSYYATNMRFPLTVNYEVDIWGKNRSNTKKAQKELEALKYDEKSAFISLTTLTASTYFNVMSIDKQIEYQKELVDIRKEILNLTKINYDYGLASSTDVTVADKSYTESLSDMETLKNNQSKLLNQLSVLTGTNSENSSTLTRSSIDNIQVLTDLPQSISSEIIDHRPDILKAEAQLQAAAIDVKVARKNMLPSINLTGFVGFNAYAFSPLFDWRSFIMSLGGGLAQPIFTGGRLMAQLRAKKYKYEQMFNMYQKTILTSMQEINDSLVDIKTETAKNQNNIKRVECETKYYNDIYYKYEKGAVSYLDTLKYKENLLSLRKEEIQSKTSLIIAALSLYKSVGGQL